MRRKSYRLEEGCNLFPLERRVSSGKPFQQKLDHLDDVTFRELVFLNKSDMHLRDKISSIYICSYRF